MELLHQLLLAFVGAMGFALIFNVRERLIFPSSFGGLLCWGVCLLCEHLFAMNGFYSAFMASACAALYAELIARTMETPATVIYITSIVPLIPGSGLYYMMSAVVQQQWADAIPYGTSTIQCALGIGGGMSIICAPFEMLARIRKNT